MNSTYVDWEFFVVLQQGQGFEIELYNVWRIQFSNIGLKDLKYEG